MLKRIFTFLAVVALIGAVASVVYFNPGETTLRLAPDRQYDMKLGYVVLISTFVGAVFVFLLFLLREGRWALRQWRIRREKRIAERARQYRAEARGLVLAGQYNNARSLLTKAGKNVDPNVVDLVDYAETYHKEDKPEEARRVLEQGIGDFGNDAQLLHSLARACVTLGDHAAAISALERAVASYPSSVDLYSLLRDEFVAQRSWKRAAEVQQRLVELESSSAAEKHRLLEIRLQATEEMDAAEAESSLKTITGMDADFAPALVARARLCVKRGNWKAAARLLEKAAKRQPAAALLDELEETLIPAQQARLLKFYGKLAASHPDDGALELRLCRCLLEADQMQEAVRLLETADAEANPALFQSLWAEVHRRQSRPEQAEACYRKAVAELLERS